jgi:multicomponent Na+:H+ antiporter subunit E
MLKTVILLAGLWWILTNASVGSWLIGLPALAGATWASARLGTMPGARISLLGLVRFVPYFLWESLRGGTDVALRTLAPRMRVRPGFYRYHTRLHASSARTFFAYCVSLLPGTLTADLQGQWLEIHTLNIDSDLQSELTRLENLVAGLFVDKGDDR